MNKSIKTFILISFAFTLVLGQDFEFYEFEKDVLPPDFHSRKREELRRQMPENSVAVFFSNPVRNRSNDVDYEYHQDPNFYYLTGFKEPNSVLVIYKDSILINEKFIHEILYVPNRDKSKEIWTGRRAGVQGAKLISAVQTVFYADDFLKRASLFQDTSLQILHLQLHKGIVNDKDDPTDLFELTDYFKSVINRNSEKGNSNLLNGILKAMREVKSEEEIEMMKKSIAITTKGFISMMENVKPGMTEYQVQAMGEYEFKKLGAENVGYPSICGSSENSIILHYTSNRKTTKDSELILLDMGAEYRGYSSDVTRTIPVNGRFTPEQRLLYELVLKAQNAGIKECKVGNEFQSTHFATSEVISEGLLKLGIIQEKDEYRRYFMHGTSHYLGLDVHDAGTKGPFKNGTIITVEPGIYIEENSPCDKKWWNIGIRIEDDILITTAGPVNLSEAAPRNPDEIEKMHK